MSTDDTSAQEEVGPTPTREQLLAILSEITMAMTTLTPAESVAGVLARHGIRLPQRPVRDLAVDVVDGDEEPEHQLDAAVRTRTR